MYESSLPSRTLPTSVRAPILNLIPASGNSSPYLDRGLADADLVARGDLGGHGDLPLVQVRAVGRPQVLDDPRAVAVGDLGVELRDVVVAELDLARGRSPDLDRPTQPVGSDLAALLVEHEQFGGRLPAPGGPGLRLGGAAPPRLAATIQVEHHRPGGPPDEEVQEDQQGDLEDREDERGHVSPSGTRARC